MAIRDVFEPVQKPIDGNAYVIRGISYPRVTHILSLLSGQHLMSWYAKQTALAAATQVAHYLQLDPAELDPDMAEFEAARSAFATPLGLKPTSSHGQWEEEHREFRRPGLEEATRFAPQELSGVLLWNSLMREPERYRDYRAWVGSAVHHLRYEWALGRHIPTGGEFIDFVIHLCRSHKWVPEPALERFESCGKDIHKSIAFDAQARWGLLRPFYEALDPEWLMNGLETCVYSPVEMYAGTLDGVWITTKAKWERTGRAWPIAGKDSAVFIEDLKNSRSLARTVPFQMAAYAKAELVHINGQEVDHQNFEGIEAMVAVHCDLENMAVRPKVWAGADVIDEFHLGFCQTNAVYRLMNDLPKAVRSRAVREAKPRPARRGERECPW